MIFTIPKIIVMRELRVFEKSIMCLALCELGHFIILNVDLQHNE